MLRTFILLFFVFLLGANSLQAQLNITSRQEKFNTYIKKFQTAIKTAKDSASRTKIYSQWWMNHMHFIQDTLGFKSFPSITDFFYFDEVKIFQFSAKGKKYLDVYLLNDNYYSNITYDVTSNKELEEIPLYKKLLNLDQTKPVMVKGNLIESFLSSTDIEKGSEVLLIIFNISSINNVN